MCFADDFSAWSHSADFRLNTTASGADIAGDVADFPLLLRLDSSLFPFGEAKADGGDIRFSGADGTALAFRMERWDASLRRAEIWIRIPLVKGGSDTGLVRMHWGNAAADPVAGGAAVFDPALGYSGVWHMQGDALKDATGNAGDADGSKTVKAAGVIVDGRALTGNNQGILAPNAAGLNPKSAITLSAWVRPDGWSGGMQCILEKGGSQIQYSLAPDPSSDSLSLSLGGLTQGSIMRGPLPAAGAWHLVTATYDGSFSRMFLDGVLVKSQPAAGELASTGDELCIGCRAVSSKPRNSFKGILDEVTVSGVARSADFIKLSYANQRAQQVLVHLPALVECPAFFSAPRDTVVSEGGTLVLKARADCASGFTWSPVSGPVPRILDPEVKNLTIGIPRISKDTVLVYRFTARFGEAYKSGDVSVRVRESIPDPLFSLPSLAAWNGKDSLVLRPSISNLSAIKGSKDSVIHLVWTLTGPEADTAWRAGALVLKHASANGPLTVGLCADNGGQALCKSTVLVVNLAVGLADAPASAMKAGRIREWRDATGRRRAGEAGLGAFHEAATGISPRFAR